MSEIFNINPDLPTELQEVVRAHNRLTEVVTNNNPKMRQFFKSETVDPKTFDTRVYLAMKKDGGPITVLLNKLRPIEDLRKYTREQQAVFRMFNEKLVDIGEPEMTDDEKDFFFKLGKYDPNNIVKEPEDLQKLAGFKVEKKIIYTDAAKGEPK